MQAIAHAPLVQDAVPFAVPHDVLQSPQWVVVVMFVSHPSDARPLQSAKSGFVHTTLEQTPLTQLSIAPPFVLQAKPQPPQLAVLVLMFVSQPFAALWSQSPKPAVQAETEHA